MRAIIIRESGRIPMAVGRDAVDAAISTAFGVAHLSEFTVFTDEMQS